MPHFTIVLIPYINSLNISWIKKKKKKKTFEEYGTFNYWSTQQWYWLLKLNFVSSWFDLICVTKSGTDFIVDLRHYMRQRCLQTKYM